jgi:hypothetical protein
MVGHMFRLSTILASVQLLPFRLHSLAQSWPLGYLSNLTYFLDKAQQVDLECFPLSTVIDHISTINLRFLKNLDQYDEIVEYHTSRQVFNPIH